MRSVNLANLGTVLVEAYERCTALTTLVLGGQLSVIDTRAFGMCSSLVVLDLLQNLRSLGDLAFSGRTACRTGAGSIDLFLEVEAIGVIEVTSSYCSSSLDELVKRDHGRVRRHRRVLTRAGGARDDHGAGISAVTYGVRNTGGGSVTERIADRQRIAAIGERMGTIGAVVKRVTNTERAAREREPGPISIQEFEGKGERVRKGDADCEARGREKPVGGVCDHRYRLRRDRRWSSCALSCAT
jgi:hypothetical protein